MQLGVVHQHKVVSSTLLLWWIWPGILRSRAFFYVRPAWAHTCGCKSRCELVTVSKVKRNCERVTDRGESEARGQAWSVSCEPTNRNRIQGTAEQGEWAINRKALVTKVRWCRCGGCATKVCVNPYLGRSRLDPERVTALSRSAKSAEVVVVVERKVASKALDKRIRHRLQALTLRQWHGDRLACTGAVERVHDKLHPRETVIQGSRMRQPSDSSDCIQ